MTSETLRLTLAQLNTIARGVVPDDNEVFGAVPARDSDYAEIVVGSAAKPGGRLTIGVRRTQPEDQIRREIDRRVRQWE